ncbi:tRNA 5-methylaminomethyl-2-thiouridine biosynthesis bifunctional protein [Rhodoferax sp. OV413]|uniref:tRNA (5-methylaminomethyl-2-thiouridine)(34)-methyltransferase MnmD n=1 Tax=Rhodoferax sp. OV413 TaxID=1855285 RepID=UPI000880F5AF|nr:tRNA (5-methylaminomethyl-2-thiouridine)(34)-methyltransferase MnmD [Rhodoferax sp. OV413]SDO04711.1 tRNA 5-methylaminomethyl-2-thiouridine biosynthesis bifunctional protein [Rhodoferax sp. OV413]
MAEPIEWLADGTPFSPRFSDRYRSESGGLTQASEVFFKGCGLPDAWADQAQWRILETGFGLGLNFLVTWAAWKADPQRPQLLHFVSIEAWPASADDLLRSFAAHPELLPLATQLHAQWWELSPGFHRLVFEGGQVMLTLCIGDAQPMLREMVFEADSVYLDGFSPQRNPEIWSLHTLKAVARHCRRGTRVATWTIARAVRDGLAQCGFEVQKTPGVPPKRDNLQGSFNPQWEPRKPPLAAPMPPSHCVVIGSGVAGAAVAASLARRGWKVTVLDAAAAPAAGASGLPGGVLAPLVSKDDNQLSRLSRSGIRATLQQAAALLKATEDWQPSGVQEMRADDSPLWHAHAGWIKPARLVQAWLDQPNITWQGNARAERLQQVADGWQVWGTDGQLLAQAPLVVVAAALGSAALAGVALPLQPIRGQVNMGTRGAEVLPPYPVNGHGSFIPDLPTAQGRRWIMGASFERDNAQADITAADHQANLERLQVLLPDAALALQAQFGDGRLQAWAGVRCAAPDRLPMVGCIAPGLWVSTAMGSRGLSFAHLCAELLAAQLHGEPWAVEKKLGAALDVLRVLKPRG